jgi:hypothetical protein
MITKHTPAHWSADGFDVLSGYFHIAKVTVHSHEMSKANTKLIAAAPDLLEALIEVMHKWECGELDNASDTFQKARAAIAKCM